MEHFDPDGCEPLLAELCETADRLESVRAALRSCEKPDGRLVNAEVKLAGSYLRTWKLLGLADSLEAKRKVGRPAGVPMRRPA